MVCSRDGMKCTVFLCFISIHRLNLEACPDASSTQQGKQEERNSNTIFWWRVSIDVCLELGEHLIFKQVLMGEAEDEWKLTGAWQQLASLEPGWYE